MTEKRDIVTEIASRIPSEETRRAVMVIMTAMATLRVGQEESDPAKMQLGKAALQRGVDTLRGTLAADLALIEAAVASLATLRDVSLLTFDEGAAARSQALGEALAELARHIQSDAWPALAPAGTG